MWLNESLLPQLLDDSALLRNTGSVLLGTLRLRQIRDTQGEMKSLYLCCELVWIQVVIQCVLKSHKSLLVVSYFTYFFWGGGQYILL